MDRLRIVPTCSNLDARDKGRWESRQCAPAKSGRDYKCRPEDGSGGCSFKKNRDSEMFREESSTRTTKRSVELLIVERRYRPRKATTFR